MEEDGLGLGLKYDTWPRVCVCEGAQRTAGTACESPLALATARHARSVLHVPGVIRGTGQCGMWDAAQG